MLVPDVVDRGAEAREVVPRDEGTARAVVPAAGRFRDDAVRDVAVRPRVPRAGVAGVSDRVAPARRGVARVEAGVDGVCFVAPCFVAFCVAALGVADACFVPAFLVPDDARPVAVGRDRCRAEDVRPVAVVLLRRPDAVVPPPEAAEPEAGERFAAVLFVP